jgi:hypothetical protein
VERPGGHDHDRAVGEAEGSDQDAIELGCRRRDGAGGRGGGSAAGRRGEQSPERRPQVALLEGDVVRGGEVVEPGPTAHQRDGEEPALQREQLDEAGVGETVP